MFGLDRSLVKCCVGLGLAVAGGPTASAAVLFSEDFSDTTLAAGSAQLNGTIAGGIISYTDASTAARARFVDIQTFTSEVMTFSFDSVAPVTRNEGAGADNELLIRAGIGTTNNTLSSTEFIFEAIAWRTTTGGSGGARINFPANGNATIFVVVNNKATDLVFDSPIDSSNVTLTGFQYINYVRDNNTGLFHLLNNAPAQNFQDRNGATEGFGGFTRFGIGNSSNGHQGTFAIDNVLVVDTVAVPEPASLGMLCVGALGLLRQRRRR